MDPDFGLAQEAPCPWGQTWERRHPGPGRWRHRQSPGNRGPTRRIHSVGVAGGVSRLGCEGINRCLHSCGLGTVVGVIRLVGSPVSTSNLSAYFVLSAAPRRVVCSVVRSQLSGSIEQATQSARHASVCSAAEKLSMKLFKPFWRAMASRLVVDSEQMSATPSSSLSKA